MLNKQSGFTIIELLISATLLAMLMLVGTYSYSTFTNKWQKELGQFSRLNRQATNFQRIQTLLNNITPNVVRKDNGEPGFFFVGGEASLLAITRDGLFSHNTPEAFKFSVIRNANNTFKLLYQAKPLEASLITSSSQQVEFSQDMVLLNDMDEISFKYLGLPHFSDKDKDKDDAVAKWSDIYSALDSQIMPDKVLLFVKQGEFEITFNIELSLNSSRWISPYWGESKE